MATFQYLDEGNSEAQDRLATSYLLAQTSPGLATTGVLAGGIVTQTATASGAVLVAAGADAVQASVGTGVALLVNDTQATLDVLTANPMGGLPRNDIVAFDSVTKALIAIIGTPNASPTDSTVPDTACAHARLRHAASATTIPTSKIDDLRVLTGLATGTWAAYSPTKAGITLGNGTITARWVQAGGTVDFSLYLVAGSTTNITGTLELGLPVAAAASTVVAGAGYRSSSNGVVGFRGASASTVFVYDASTGIAWTAATDFVAGATLRLSGSYEAA